MLEKLHPAAIKINVKKNARYIRILVVNSKARFENKLIIRMIMKYI